MRPRPLNMYLPILLSMVVLPLLIVTAMAQAPLPVITAAQADVASTNGGSIMNRKTIFAFLFVTLLLFAASASAQTTSFTHQGNLGFSASGSYDFELKLYDMPALGTGTQQGATIDQLNISVTNGDFTLQLDFGAAAFTGAELYLETGWRPSGSGSFTVLPAREKITAVYANRSLSAAIADSATNATQLGGVSASGFIQNTTAQQAGGFNIAGDGTAGGTLSAGIVNASTQFNLGGGRILSGNGDYLSLGTGTAIAGFNCTIVGNFAGANNTGVHNSFFGKSAGASNVNGNENSFFGVAAGLYNTSGNYNAFFGESSGLSNTIGYHNSTFGSYAGLHNTTGVNNVSVGYMAGFSNTTGSGNTLIGYMADLSANNFSNATAIGANAYVQQSNSIVLGSINGVNSASADTAVGIGTTTPAFKLHVIDPSNTGLRVQTNAAGGTVASFGGNGDFSIDGPGIPAGRFVVKEGGNVGIGIATPADRLVVNGAIRVLRLGSAGSTQLCFNLASQISTCSSSLRYKTNIAPFSGGLSLINRLQPITFNWKAGGEADLGLGAEDVAKVEPLLVTHNEKGEIEGVKYDRVAVILLNAVKEQQQQIESLRRIVCQDHPQAGMCEANQGLTAASRVKLRRRRSLASTHFGPVR